MRLLLDTHILIWLAGAPELLSRGEIAVLNRASEPPIVSIVSLWEIRMKWDKRRGNGERKGTVSPTAAFDCVEQMAFVVTPLTAADCLADLTQSIETNDPFDQMLLIQAQHIDARLLTRDRRLIDHPIAISG